MQTSADQEIDIIHGDGGGKISHLPDKDMAANKQLRLFPACISADFWVMGQSEVEMVFTGQNHRLPSWG